MTQPLSIAVTQPRCAAHDVGADAGQPAVLVVDGWRLGLAVCRDTGIPEHAASMAALGIDGYVAGVVHADHEAEVHSERARRAAADHGVRVATAAPDDIARAVFTGTGSVTGRAG